MYQVSLFYMACMASAVVSLGDLLFNWENYKRTYGKHYANQTEDSIREAIYTSYCQSIASRRLPSNGSLYEIGVNRFSDLTDSEALAEIKCCREPDESALLKLNVTRFIRPPQYSAAPSINWVTAGYVTAVKNQGTCKSCYAFAATGALEGQYFKQSSRLRSLSEQQIVDCSNTANYSPNDGCQGGSTVQALNYIEVARGLQTEESYPYEANATLCRGQSNEVVATSQGVTTLTTDENLLAAVQLIGPIAVQISVSKSLLDYTAGIFTGDCPGEPIHAALVVGYGSEDGNDFWLVKNSWGLNWGEDGYFRIDRGTPNKCQISSLGSVPLLLHVS